MCLFLGFKFSTICSNLPAIKQITLFKYSEGETTKSKYENNTSHKNNRVHALELQN